MAGEQDHSRTDPFAEQPPNTARDYSRAPSDLSTAASADRARALDGQQVRYRLAFVAMEVPGLPAVVKIDPVEITQQAGPIWTQHTYIRHPTTARMATPLRQDHAPGLPPSRRGAAAHPGGAAGRGAEVAAHSRGRSLSGGTKCSPLSASSRHCSTNG